VGRRVGDDAMNRMVVDVSSSLCLVGGCMMTLCVGRKDDHGMLMCEDLVRWIGLVVRKDPGGDDHIQP
jgi:hypothetical protein